MGLFDEVKCKYPLAYPESQNATFQTKDLECYQQDYEIREDGTLWHHKHDSELRKDASSPFGITMDCSNYRWEQVHHQGELCIYHYEFVDGMSGSCNKQWQYTFWFRDGVINDVIAEFIDNTKEQVS